MLPSVILRKLAAAGPDNALSRALRALGGIERTMFTLLSDPGLRQRSHAGLNKGVAYVRPYDRYRTQCTTKLCVLAI